jgi:hypothetical protein
MRRGRRDRQRQRDMGRNQYGGRLESSLSSLDDLRGAGLRTNSNRDTKKTRPDRVDRTGTYDRRTIGGMGTPIGDTRPFWGEAPRYPLLAVEPVIIQVARGHGNTRRGCYPMVSHFLRSQETTLASSIMEPGSKLICHRRSVGSQFEFSVL